MKIDKSAVKNTKLNSNTTDLSADHHSDSSEVTQKKGQTFQATWKGKIPWISHNAAENEVFYEA